ncbi:DnaD domain protein [Oscillibacter hominis]|uniref:DnaD domain protein n=1 Tax=Oscillibacter hominis TaxID=2763056 RepID=A0A7G9B3T2_9FIRM|nr:DnaD domain protein [Oscillibacter hominis]QNL44213.1 DnaD domain protein [Oscillibacter hominis]
MASCLLPVDGDESVLVSGPVLRRLIGSGSGDAALLYLCLLRRRGEISTEQAGRELKWDRMRLQTAEDELRAMNLLGAGEQREAAPSPPPAYEREDVLNCLEHSEEFRCLTAEVERKLGKKLSTPDLGTLLGLYDYLGLPADVIYLLVCHCMERSAARYGPGRRPSLRRIEQEGYAWAARGIDTQERAAAYLKQYALRQGMLPRYMEALQLGDRPPAPSEEKYLAAWADMGFSPEAVALAYDRTMLRCHKLKMNYLDGILKKWDEKGLHTVDEIQSGDGPRPAPVPAAAQGSRRSAAELKKYLK